MTASGNGIAYLDGPRLSRGLEAGILRVLSDRDHLNRINVFPVADGDTGTNLALTMNAVLAELRKHRSRHAGRTLERVADAALDGARGNSGAIMAQFFQGLSDACGELDLITTSRFVDAVRSAEQYAREAMIEPREGTIVTVIKAFSRELDRLRDATHDFAELLEKGLARASKALAETTGQLDELRKAGVVDAGARGFVDLLQGVTDLVRDGLTDEGVGNADSDLTTELEEESAIEYPEADGVSGHRYCTECVINGVNIEHRSLKEALAGIGSSLVVAGTRNKARVHIHVDEPQQLFDIASRFGEISSRKADDMFRQGAARASQARVAIVTDSAGDIPEDEFERLDVHMVPVRVHFGNKSFLDKVSLTSDEFYAELESNPHHPKTSQPAPGDFRRLYEFLGSHHPAILSVHLTGQVSGTYQAAESAAGRAHTDTPIITIDSKNASVGQGLITIQAAELARQGHDVDEIATRLDRAIETTRTFGVLGDLAYSVRGGRVPQSRKFIADFLRLDPVLKTFPDGRIASAGVLLGRRNTVAKFARFIAKQVDTDRPYLLAVGHAGDPDRADRLAALLKERLRRIVGHYVTELGPALGAHGGRGSLVVALQEAQELDSVARSGTAAQADLSH